MKQASVVILLLVLGLAAFLIWTPFEKDDRPRVEVYAYSSFVSTWGPGKELKTLFEKTCDCIVDYVEASDAGLLLQRLELEGAKSGVDLVLGFDQLDIARAQKVATWRPLELPAELRQDLLPFLKGSPFAPFDWAPLSFVINTSKTEFFPTTLDELLAPELAKSIVLQDPRVSSPGLQFLIWTAQVKGIAEAKGFLKKLFSQIYRVTPSWSQAYGLFQEGHVPMVWSYVTSPIVHIEEQGSEEYRAVVFAEGHPLQIELMGIPSYCNECELAESFARFLMSPEAQKVIMTRNYMFPVLDTVREGTLFAEVPEVKLSPIDYKEAMKTREELLELWTELRREL